MADAQTLARRTPVLAPAASGRVTQVTPLAPAARFVLRIRDAETVPAGTIAGFDFSRAINTCSGTPGRFAARLGPDEWLIVAPEAEGAQVCAELEQGLAGRFFSLVDVGSRNCGIRVAGPHARDVLNAGIALDLADTAFPAGSATRTLLGKADVVLVRATQEDSFQVECWRSFAPYVHTYLNEVAQEFA
ncbi:sarcosine oxidase subunit gamma [Roseixanthobacter glucoisosaccharinicivorans]|uniref:sarcosine oxidase subunit gamma n=1 Tax=Roseixanthobacter glucoisosaccharinicivorans TaxID=3119923 RepID=UPI003726934E